MSGKFLIKNQDNGFYRFTLVRDDGSVIATSRDCWDLEDCEHCVRSCRKRLDAPVEDQTVEGFLGVPLPKYEIYFKKGTYRVRQWTSVGRIICMNDELTSKEACFECIEDIKKYAADSIVVNCN